MHMLCPGALAGVFVSFRISNSSHARRYAPGASEHFRERVRRTARAGDMFFSINEQYSFNTFRLLGPGIQRLIT
jgi:hypothetical protein